jgi:hypothetical protein
LTIFTDQKAEPEEIQKNIIVVLPDTAGTPHSIMDIYSKSLGTKLDHSPGNETPLKRPEH